MKIQNSLLFVLGTLVSGPHAAAADWLAGPKEITLVQQDGTRHVVGKVTFEPENDGAGYMIEWRREIFEEHFLSMRPFKCLEGSGKYWCRVPYPYEINRKITPRDLTDLEYDLLFVWKGADDYGINLWNGVYYKLAGGEKQLVGTLHEIDMNVLSVPPEDGTLRPVREQDLEPGDPDSHWLPRLVIE